MSEKMIEPISWKEFRDSGMIWLINSMLQQYGLALVCKVENEEVIEVLPAKTKYRGFSETINDDGFKRVTRYLKENIDELIEVVEGE